MSAETLRIALNAANFPFLYRDAQRAVMLKGNDQQVNYAPYYGTNESSDWNQVQLLYCENVMPSAKGYMSTHFLSTINPYGVSETRFDQAIILRDNLENNTLLVPAGGQNFILDTDDGSWDTTESFTATGQLVTRAYTQGRTFVCYDSEKLFEFDGGANDLTDQTSSLVLPAGYTMADIRGCGGGSNYLILFTDIEVLWSSPNDPLNFDNSLNNGSGVQIPQDARGAISCILPVSGGAIIYTVRNAVAMQFTNNATTPFAFRGIANSGGVAGYEQVAFDSDEQDQYVWGSGGLQKMSLQRAESVFPECSDFLTSSLYETYNYTTHKVDTAQLGSYLSVKLTFVAQRYLCISYGATPGTFTAALIYDTGLKRWGKIVLAHTDIFTYPYPNIEGDLEYGQLNIDYSSLSADTYSSLGVGILSTSPPKKSIAILQADGTIYILAVDYSLRTAQGVAIFGQIQHNRNRMTTLHAVEFEGLDRTATPEVYLHESLNGKDISSVSIPALVSSSTEYSLYKSTATAKNLSIVLAAAFQLTGLLVRVAKGGRTNQI